ncbi:MAG: phosphopantetheine adenylyltransferase [Thermoprotei archaeon]|nr:MAG: phosphopantetheine adenylyltransferase [Thermoprotei archaeon]RLE82454.1 MAG: phosphopantetheine adenylyltransferase [Thermoprotei archaeon]RLF02523.1 MAG: phosphopantetheine adenylyltransferase [Thermoprotei archaeon]
MFSRVGVGGTFSLLHKGHKVLIATAFKCAKEVVIGLSSDILVKSLRKQHFVPNYEVRFKILYNFLKTQGYLSKALIVPLLDPYGPAIDDRRMDAIVVSEEGYKRALEINSLRRKHGLEELHIIVVRMVLAEDGKPINCTRIMRGEIDVEGRVIRKETL